MKKVNKEKIISFLENEINILKKEEEMVDADLYQMVFDTAFTENVKGEEVYVDTL